MSSGVRAGGAVTGKGRWCREHGVFQMEGSSVSKDLEAKVCVLENSKYPCWAGRFRGIIRRSRADKIVKRKTFPHLLSRCSKACQSAGREFSKTYFYNSEI